MLDNKEEIKIANIEQELTRLWDEQKENKQVKACLFNLIIYTHESRRAAYFKKVTKAIIEKFPSRVIFIEGKKESDTSFIHVSVSTETSGAVGSLVACDQITIETAFSQIKRVPFIVMPHLVTDLPLYLLWGQDPTSEDELLPYFQKFSTRLIFDSECTKDLQQFSKQMLEKFEKQKMDFMDMNWALISGWRKVLAAVFDTPQKNQLLKSPKKLTIYYNSKKTEFFEHYETQSIYLQGWLAAQMGWAFDKTKSDKSRIIDYKNGTCVEILSKIHETHPSGAILSVEIDCGNGTLFQITREKIWSKAVCHISYADLCEVPHLFPMPDLEKGFQFMREVFFSKPGIHYKNMLEAISKINWELTCK